MTCKKVEVKQGENKMFLLPCLYSWESTSFSPFSKEVKARATAYSFLCFQHIGRGLAVGRCLSHISEQIKHVGKEEYPHVRG